MNRREFLTYAWGGALGLVALQVGVGLFYFLMPRFKAGEFGGVLVAGGAVSGKTETSTLYIFRALDERQYIAAYGVALVLALVSFTVLIGMELLRQRAEAKTGQH